MADAPELVAERVHGCTPDEGSNMLKGWRIFEGSGCVCHRAQSSLRVALSGDEDVQSLISKIKGIVAHFHRSVKVHAF